MEKRIEDYDKAWVGIKRPSFEDFKGKSRTIKVKKKKAKVDRLDDMRVLGSMCIMILKFFVLLNILVLTSRML
ncbi:hypothetical protein ERM19_15340 [Clostridioides difficile]|jgi:hypothetical protein|nr:hypothetical protein [Clostridioides difficile]DAU66081.1 MAG TPA: hypothetical protein [Caudoviricetes sp.]